MSPSLVTFLFPSSIWTSSSVFILVALIFWQGVGVGSGEAVIVLLLCQAKEDTPHTSLLPRKIMCLLCTLEGYSPSIMQNAPQNGFLWYFCTIGLRLFLFGRNHNHTEMRHMLLIYRMTRYFNFDHLIEEVFLRFLLGKITLFLFVINKYVVGRYLETM